MLATMMKIIILIIGSIFIAFTIIPLHIVHMLKEMVVSGDLTALRFFLTPQASELFERGMQQSISSEMESLFLRESFQVACSSVLKEMAVSCDLTALEEVIPFLNFSPK